jgi:hypothetical protein
MKNGAYTVDIQFLDRKWTPQRTYRRRVEIGGSVSALSAGVYTATLDVMVDIVHKIIKRKNGK